MSLRGRAGAAAALAMVLAGCAADLPADEASRPDDALTWNEDIDLSGLQLAVGSKSTVEQQVLGHLAAEALTATGADVTDQIDLGGTLVVRDAQLGGLIDLYWEYTGTGWVDLLREIGPSDDADELAEAVAETDLDENGVAWLAPAPADSSFGLATGPNVADGRAAMTVSDLGDLLDENTEGVVVCIPDGGTFRDDPTGLPAFNRALERRGAGEEIVTVPGTDLVPAVEAGVFCPYGQVLRTSPALLGADVDLLEDDVGAFLIRNPAVTVRSEVLSEFPELASVLEPVAAALTDEALQELNAAVVVDGEDPRAAAREWLISEGFADR